jgi:hypothetical protein
MLMHAGCHNYFHPWLLICGKTPHSLKYSQREGGCLNLGYYHVTKVEIVPISGILLTPQKLPDRVVFTRTPAVRKIFPFEKLAPLLSPSGSSISIARKFVFPDPTGESSTASQVCASRYNTK